FAGLDRVELARLTAYVDAMTIEDAAVLYVQGDTADAVYIVSQGTLGIYVSTGDGSGETRLNMLSAGDCIGEMALVSGEPRSATVRAIGRAEVLRLDRATFLDLVRREPSVANAVTTIM